jgi:uncharacterized protein YjbJ (UPF0337 family)
MEEKMDDLKGRAKEAVGDLTDDDALKREGKADQAGAKVKKMVEKAKDKVEDVVDKAKESSRTRSNGSARHASAAIEVRGGRPAGDIPRTRRTRRTGVGARLAGWSCPLKVPR